MISASKNTYSHYNFKILKPKFKKNSKNLCKKFCEFPPSDCIHGGPTIILPCMSKILAFIVKKCIQ